VPIAKTFGALQGPEYSSDSAGAGADAEATRADACVATESGVGKTAGTETTVLTLALETVPALPPRHARLPEANKNICSTPTNGARERSLRGHETNSSIA
jgi:hypothetical protein